jgi:hypothetical protein
VAEARRSVVRVYNIIGVFLSVFFLESWFVYNCRRRMTASAFEHAANDKGLARLQTCASQLASPRREGADPGVLDHQETVFQNTTQATENATMPAPLPPARPNDPCRCELHQSGWTRVETTPSDPSFLRRGDDVIFPFTTQHPRTPSQGASKGASGVPRATRLEICE